MEVIVQDANNIVIEVDQGRQGRGVEDVSLITVGADYYLLFTFTDGTTEQVGPIATTVTEVISAEVRNAEAVTILKGQPVYLYQAQGNLATVKLAYNTSDATSAKTLGLAAENIAPGAQGLITCQGTLGGLNTSAYSEGDTLYLGATAGTLTNVKPQAPNHLVYIGVVERANAGAGQIYVRVQNGYELDEIHDVQINSPVNGNTLIYDASTSLWKNAGITAGSGVSVTNGPASITVGNTGVLSLSGGTTGLTPATATTGAVTLAGTLGIANGGTGQTTANAALNALLPAQTSQSGKYLKTDGSNAAWDQLDISTADITGTLPIANGGTGQSTANAGLNALLPSQTSQSGKYLKTDGTNASWDQLDISTADITGILPTANGGTGLTSFTSGGVVYASSSSALTTGSALTFDGTSTFGVTSSTVAVAKLFGGTGAGNGAYFALYAQGANAGYVGTDSGITGGGTSNDLTLYPASTNNIRFYQGGSEQMRLTSTGLGIGTSSPAVKLDVSGSSAVARVVGTAGTVPQLSLSSAGVVAWSLRSNNDGASDFTIYQDSTQRLKIDSSGNLGIGTSSPGLKLDVRGASGSGVRYIETTTGNTNRIELGAESGVSFIKSDAGAGSTALGFRAGSATDLMRLDSSGNLGIGTSSPARKLDVNGAVRIADGTVVEWGGISCAISGSSSTNTLIFSTASTERMRLDSSGNVGIGTSSPASNLNVVGDQLIIAGGAGTSQLGIQIKGAALASLPAAQIQGYIATGDSALGLAGDLLIAPRTDVAASIRFITGTTPAERMRLDASGNLGIGTSSPSTIGVSGYTRLVLGTGSSATEGLTIVPSGTGGIQFTDAANTQKGFVQWDSSTGALAFGTAATERMRLDASGNLGIGTSSPATKLHVNTGAAGYGVTIAASTQTSITYQLGIDSNSNLAIYDTNAAAQRLVLSNSGNLGLGVTPSATASPYKSIELFGAYWMGGNNTTPASYSYTNAYFDGSDKYKTSGFAASLYRQLSGTHAWFTAPSGTAGNAISFSQVMTLDASGNLGVGTTSPTSGFRLDVQAADAKQRIESTTGTNSVQQRFVNTGGTFYAGIDNSTGSGFGAAYCAALWHTGNYPMLFATNNTERARITSAGDLITNVNGTAPSLSTNSTMSFELTSNTSLKIVVRGTDGVTRSVSLTLA